MGCYGENLRTEAYSSFCSALKRIGATDGDIQWMIRRAAYSTITLTARILTRHMQAQV